MRLNVALADQINQLGALAIKNSAYLLPFSEDALEDFKWLEREIEQGRTSIMEAVATTSQLRNQFTQAEERLAAVDRESERLQNEISTASSQVEAFGGQRGQLALEFETVSQRVSGLTAEIVQVRQSLESKRHDENEAKRQLDPNGRAPHGRGPRAARGQQRRHGAGRARVPR